MVISSKISDALRTIGLNKYERNLWVALLSRGSASAGELADISKVPRSRCYDVLESLADKGFVVVQPGKPIRYVAIQPKESMNRAKKKVRENAEETCTRIDRLVKSETIKELERIHKNSLETVSPEDLSGSLRGRYALTQQMETMLKKAKKYAKLITTESGLSELEENHSSLLQRAQKAGIKIHILVPITRNNIETAKNLSKYAQVRDIGGVPHVNKMTARFCSVDGEEFLVGLTDDSKIHPTQDVSFWTQSSHATANIFEPMFNIIWNNAKSIR